MEYAPFLFITFYLKIRVGILSLKVKIYQKQVLMKINLFLKIINMVFLNYYIVKMNEIIINEFLSKYF
jgi:hypothetical protein